MRWIVFFSEWSMMSFSRPGRSSFRAPERIHSTLQKAVKDGNVLEKIKVFEMQAAAAQAESAMKLIALNHRVQTVTSSLQSAAYRTLSPVIVHPIQHPITPVPLQQHQQQQYHQPMRSGRDHHVHPVQSRRDASHGPIMSHESRKGAHVLEPAHGDIILRRRTPSQRTAHDEDYSITAISSLAVTSSQAQHHHHHNRSRPQQHQQQQRSNTSRSRPRQEMVYDKRAPSNHEHTPHKHQQKSKGTTTPSSKSSGRRRWLKSRKETPTETPIPREKPEATTGKSNKGHKSKKKTPEQDKTNAKKGSTSDPKRKSSTDNNRVYGVPKPEANDPIRLESSPPPPHLEEKIESDPEKDNTNTYMAPKTVELSSNRECETVPISNISRRTSKKQHQQKLSSTDGEILNKITDQLDPNDDEVFLIDSPLKSPSNITRHQSAVNLSNSEPRHFHRHTSQYSADELTPNMRRYQRSNENLLKKKALPLTIITRKNKLNPDEQNVYETPHSEQVPSPTCHTHTLKKQRPFHTITASGNGNNKQISKQILHAIMNSMNNTQDQPTRTSSVYDEFFENGPLTNPEETLANITT